MPSTETPQARLITWPRAHWLVGTLTLLLFPLAGVYMRYVAAVPQLEDAPRLVYRSRFLLLLLIAVANLALSHAQPKLFMQRIASAIILAAPLPLIAAFFLLPATASFFADWLWFEEVGYAPVFLRSVTARSLVAAAVLAGAFGFFLLNMRYALSAMPDGPLSITTVLLRGSIASSLSINVRGSMVRPLL